MTNLAPMASLSRLQSLNLRINPISALTPGILRKVFEFPANGDGGLCVTRGGGYLEREGHVGGVPRGPYRPAFPEGDARATFPLEYRPQMKTAASLAPCRRPHAPALAISCPVLAG